MKASNVQGHCQACGRIQVALANSGLMSQHGYKVRSGYFSGVCIGHDHLPLEQDRSYLDWVVVDLERHAKMHDKHVVQLKNGESVPSQALKRDTRNNLVYGPRNPRTYQRDPILVNWSEASPVERQMQIDLDIGTSESESRFARSHAKSLLELAHKVHGQRLIDREVVAQEKRQERAAKRAPIEGAYRTKAAKKDALESLSRMFGGQRSIIMEHYLAMPREGHDSPGSQMYDAMPFDLHCWRQKHAALVRAAYPSMEGVVQEIDRLFAERLIVKSRPVIK